MQTFTFPDGRTRDVMVLPFVNLSGLMGDKYKSPKFEEIFFAVSSNWSETIYRIYQHHKNGGGMEWRMQSNVFGDKHHKAEKYITGRVSISTGGLTSETQFKRLFDTKLFGQIVAVYPTSSIHTHNTDATIITQYFQPRP